MKQVLRKGLKEIIVDEVPDPILRPQAVLIRPAYSLISSGTETASIHTQGVVKEVADNPSHLKKVLDAARITGPGPTLREVKAKFSEYGVLGYSGAGVIVDRHPSVRDLEIGGRVAYGGEGSGHAETILASRNLVARVPDAVPFEHACFATLASIGLNAVRIANLGLGEHTVVLGLGLVGQLIAQLARLQGSRVAAVDLRAERVQLAQKLGAHAGIAGSGSVRAAIHELTNGRGADCVIVAAAAKSAVPCQQALELCRDRGRIVVVGAVEMSFPWQEMYLKEIQLFMARAYGPGSYDPAYETQGHDYPLPYVRWTENRNMEEALRLMMAGNLNVKDLISHEFPLHAAPGAYETIMNPASGSLAVLLRYPAAESTPAASSYRPAHRVDIPGARPSPAPVEFALVGAGNIARWWHLPAIQAIPEAGLRAVCSLSGARGKSYGLRFRAAYCCSNYEEVLQDDKITAVLIASRNQQHASQALAALRAGKHVFVEKPMALTAVECRELLAAVRETGCRLAVGFNRRFSPFYRDFKDHFLRRRGPAVLNCRMNSPGISSSYWMADPAIGGAILGEACHFVDLMYWLLESEPVTVSAFSLPTGKQDPIGENNLAAAFRFADGSVANLTYCTVGSRTSAGERVEAFGPGLGATLDNFQRLTLHAGLRRSRSKWWPDKGYEAQLRSFVNAVRSGAPTEVTVVDGARSTIACLAMLEAARSLQPTAIELPTA